MKTDSIFYRIFLDLPQTFFELIGLDPAIAQTYEFTSREVKQLAFRIDGLFFPKEDTPANPFYLVEVQFQPDPRLYHRIFAELFLFLSQAEPQSPWRVVVIYQNRSVERIQAQQFANLLALPEVTRIYLDELAPQPFLELGLLQLIVSPETTAIALAQDLADRARTERPNIENYGIIIELIEKILWSKFPQRSLKEIQAMFTLTELEQTRAYQDLMELATKKGMEKGMEQGMEQGMEKGMEQGMEKGLEQGLEKGIQQKNEQAIARMTELGLDIEIIATALDLTIEAVKAIQAKNINP